MNPYHTHLARHKKDGSRYGAFIMAILLMLSLVAMLSSHPAYSASLPAESYPHRQGKLTPDELRMALIAWRYFQNNYQPKTGLVNAVNNYPSTTMWDSASYLAALVSARELGIIPKAEFDKRMFAILKTFNSMALFNNELPNKAYHTQTAEKVDYTNKPGEIGYSALDIGRLLIWLKIIKERYPEHGNAIDKAVMRWNFNHIIDKCGTLYGALILPDKKISYVQEGRLGYEEYSAKGFQLWGFSTCMASKPEPYAFTIIQCVAIPYDIRDPRKLSQHNYVVSESYVLDGLEFNWDKTNDTDTHLNRHSHPWMKQFADRVYQAQENRYLNDGVLTARSEHQLDGPPYFVYDTIYSDGYPWNTITDTGKFVPQYAAISLKAALGMWALWQSDYTDRLYDAISDANESQKGFFEGIYENGNGPIREFTANNNGIMLEALLFKQQGKLLRFGNKEPTLNNQQPSLWERTLIDPFEADNKIKNRPLLLDKAENHSQCSRTSPLFANKSLCSQCSACAICKEDDDKLSIPLPQDSICQRP